MPMDCQDTAIRAPAGFSTRRDFEFELDGIKSNADHASNECDSILETRDPVGRPDSLQDLKRIGGHFVLESTLGHGSSGTVFRAYDERLERYVAIKVIHQSLPSDGGAPENFFAEARSLAKLPHACIVQVYEIGATSVSPYLVTELVDGPSLRELLQQGAVSHRTAAEIMMEVAAALDFAHKNGVLHRDLKPSNILLMRHQRQSESRSGAAHHWLPKITDFGLAKRIDGGQTSAKRQIVGTPAYMSPESARGIVGEVDCRSDIFSLGVVLYELLANRLPFSGTLGETLAKVRQCDVVPPRRIAPRVPADLEAICLKCLQKSPESRYSSAAELHADLRGWLQGRPISARRAPRMERAAKWCYRQPLLASATIGCAGLILLTVGLSLTLYALQSMNAWKEHHRNVDMLMGAEEGAIQEGLEAIRNVSESLEIVRARLDLESTDWNARARLLLVEGPQNIDDAQLLWRRLAESNSPEEFDTIVDWLSPYWAELKPSIGREADDGRAVKNCMVILRWPTSASEKATAIETLVELLCSPSFDARWLPLMEPYRREIVAAILKEYEPETRTRELCESGCNMLCKLCHGDTDLLCSLLQIAGDDDVAAICEALRPNRAEAVAHLSTKAEEYKAGLAIRPSNRPPIAERDAYLVISQLSRTIIAIAQLSHSAQEWEHHFRIDDPRIEAYFVQGAARQGLDANRLAGLLHQDPQPSALRAVVLAMDGLRPRQFRGHPVLLNWLKQSYLSNADAGVHSSIRYVLEKFREGSWALTADQSLKGIRKPGFDWFVDSLGQTMVLLPTKVSCNEKEETVQLTVAISSTEITYEQLRSLNFSTLNRATGQSPIDDSAAQLVTPRNALDYCNALDDLEGFAENERAVTKQIDANIAAGSVALTAAKDSSAEPSYEIDRRKTGYRLPTAAELETAAEFELLADAWRRDSDPAWLGCYFHPRPYHPVTRAYSRMPNRHGMFQILGNIWEWTIENEHCDSSAQRLFNITPQDRLYIVGGPIDQQTNLLFGKASKPLRIIYEHPQVGFRVVRTLEDGENSQ